MSSHKVRIYELSKELDLDNKDILAVCNQLNIAVKNHSSTITESEAERIRNAALKLGAGALNRPAPVPPSTDSEPRRPSPVSKPLKQKRPRKQQILELRKRPKGGSQEPAAKGNVPLVTRPTPPSHPSPPRPPRPHAPEVKSKGQAAPTAPSSVSPAIRPKPTPPQPVKATSNAVEVPVRPATTVPAAPSAAPAPVAAASQSSVAVKPQLLQKPTLRSSPTPPPKPLVNRPSPSAEATQPPASPSRERPVLTKPNLPKVVRPGATVDRNGDRRDLSQPQDENSQQSDQTDSMGVQLLEPLEPLQLKRPNTARPKHDKTSRKQEEVEERSTKFSKSGKQKRRSQAQVEEDDELFAEDTNAQSVIDVSQSLVRPPKPKSAKQARPTMMPSMRTSAPKGNRRSNRNRDRQPQEVIERPAKLALVSDLTVQELASQLVMPETEVIKTLFMKGIAANINQVLDIDTIKMVAEEFEIEVETIEQESTARKVTEMLDVDDLENLQRRPPVVTIMGHVDHGKTTLLDAIRATKVAQGEAGGITQHIGAYHVDLPHDDRVEQVVFLDTPGHEAFTAMRARGARVTDIAILVVAADDGVRPQTIEAISHARAAQVPIIVAINKMDKEGAQPDRVRQELTEHNLVPEEWGGETIMVPVSALKDGNLDTLLEMILLVAEVEDLQANPDRPAKGTVIEAHLDKAKGPVASLLVQNGTLRVGDILVAGSVFGKVRAMVDDRGQRVEQASPSFAVEVLGLSDVPAAGDEFDVFSDEREARALANERAEAQRQSRLQQSMSSRKVSLGSLSDQVNEGELKELNLIVKADVQGSVEAILGALGQLPQNEVQLRILMAAPGEISETDVDLAAASEAVILGFSTSLASGARQAADQAGVDIREYDIIYKLLEDIEAAMEGLLEPELVEEALGQAEVRAVFPVGRGSVAGCYIQSGKLVRNCRIRIHQNGQLVHEGILDSLKRIKEDAREVTAGYECGIGVNNFNDWAEGDRVEAFQMVTKRRTLSPA